MTYFSASRYSPIFREELGASASASLGLLDPDCAAITSQNT